MIRYYIISYIAKQQKKDNNLDLVNNRTYLILIMEIISNNISGNSSRWRSAIGSHNSPGFCRR